MSRLLATLVFFISLSLSAQAYAALAGELDASFNPSDIGFGNGDGANNTVKTTVLQADGKIVIGGSFTSYNSTAANRVGRVSIVTVAWTLHLIRALAQMLTFWQLVCSQTVAFS